MNTYTFIKVYECNYLVEITTIQASNLLYALYIYEFTHSTEEYDIIQENGIYI